MAIDYDQMKGWEEENRIQFEELYIDDQDFVKLNGQRGPKNDAKYFLDIVNFETLLRFLFKFTPDTEKPLLKKRLPTIAKEWYKNSVYKEMYGAVSLDEMNQSFLQEQLNYINPVYVQRRMNELYSQKYMRDSAKKEKFSSGKNAVKQNPAKKKQPTALRGQRPKMSETTFRTSEIDNFVDLVADKNIDNKYVYAEYGDEYHDYNTGKLIQTIDPNGSISEIDYDGFGRPVSERSSSDTSYTTLINKSSYTYNDIMGTGGFVPYVQKTVYYSPTISEISYILMDGLGREIRSINQSGTSFIASDTVYENMGRVYKKSLPYSFSGSPINYLGATTNNNIITTNYYDSFGRVTSSVNTLGANTNIYNLNTTTIIDPDNHTKDIVTDAYGKIINVIEHNGANTYTTTYNWGQLGNLVGLTDALGNIRTFTYDMQGNRLSSTDLHDSSDTSYGTYTYKYDKNNNLIQKITPNGDIIDYVYDDLNMLIRESNNSTTQITYTYDICLNGIGQLCSVNRVGSSLKSFSYNNRGLSSSDLTTLNGKVWSMQYIYDYLGNFVQIKYPDNSSVRYTYNGLGQIITIEKQDSPTGTWQSVITNITYNPIGQKEIVNYANGRTQTYTYDNVHQYQLIRNLLDAPTLYTYPNFIDTQYKWTNTGNLSEKNENFNLMNPQKFTYNYDGLSRLTSVNKTVNAPLVGYTENYSYNSIGNLLNKTGSGSYLYNGTVPGVYANPHAATSVASANYNYDKNGNLTGWGTVPNNTTLNYNYRNELTSYIKITPPAVNNTYLYDYSGSRIKSTTSLGTVYTPSKYFEENGTIKKKYVYLGDQLIATIEVNGTSTPNIYYIHPDYLGGTQIVTDSSGSLKNQDLEYYPFGQILSNSKSSGFDEAHKFTGHLYDNDTGLNFMQARYQNGIEGRFWQQDPITRELDNSKLESLLTNPQMWNTYAYATNNPLKYVDPDGKFVQTFIARELLIRDIAKSPNIPNTVREANFLINSPIKGISIGLAKDGSTKNLSSVSSNFAVNSINLESGYTGNQSDEGTERNAFRHVLWQSMISSRYNANIAKNAGNAHEYNPFVDLSIRSFNNLYEADQTADLLNNQIGRELYSRNQGANEVQLARFSLDLFYFQGLYTVSNSNGVFNVSLSKITNDQYKSSSEIINSLGANGLSNNKK